MQNTYKKVSVTVALLALWAVATAAQAPSPEDQLAAAEAKWAANKPKAYEFSLKFLACCVIRLGPGSEPMVFHVRNDIGSLTGVWAARPPQASQGMDKYSTIDKVFAAIHEELAKRPYRFEIEYDAALGYPRRFYAKRFENADDDHYTITIEGFRVLAR